MPNSIVNCEEATKKIIDTLKQNDKIIIVYHMNTCRYCVEFMPILENLLRQKQELLDMANIFTVEIQDFEFLPKELTEVSGFPHIASYSIEGNKLKRKEFNSQRTPENVEKFIKENRSFTSSPQSSSVSASQSLRSSKRHLKKISRTE